MDYKKRTISVAPMLDWTDRHCRYFHRLISRHTWLYTEMVTTGALLFGDVARHLDFSEEEHPIALQLGGSEPGDLAQCARLGEKCAHQQDGHRVQGVAHRDGQPQDVCQAQV